MTSRQTERPFRRADALVPATLLAVTVLTTLTALGFSAHNQSEGEPPPITIDPITVCAEGLRAQTAVSLAGWGTLAAGEHLLPGDLVEDGAVENASFHTVAVVVGESWIDLAPGAILVAAGPGSPGPRCACQCGTKWRVLDRNAANCADNPPVPIGAPCIEPGTHTLARWERCTNVHDVVSGVLIDGCQPVGE